jgi:hypothetical protein
MSLWTTGAPVAEVIPSNLTETREASAGVAFVGLLIDAAAIFLNFACWILLLLAAYAPFYAEFVYAQPLQRPLLVIPAAMAVLVVMAAAAWLLSRAIARHGRISLILAGLACFGLMAFQIHALGPGVTPNLVGTAVQAVLLVLFGAVFFVAAWKRRALDG